MYLDAGLLGTKGARLSDYLPDGMREDRIADEAEVMHGGGSGGIVIKMPRERLRPFQAVNGEREGTNG